MGNLEVKQWFDDGKDYAAGVALYERFGKNKLLLRNFKRINNVANQKKLEYELGKLLPKPEVIKTQPPLEPIVVNVEAIVEQQVQQYESKQVELIKQLPEELLPVLLRANMVWKENCLLKLQLNDLPDEAEGMALELQLKIDRNWKENVNCWKQIDYYFEHKSLPEAPKSDFDGLTGAQLAKRQQYHFQNISKLKGRITENRNALAKTDSVKVKARLERAIAKQESNLLAKEKELEIITGLVNGK